MVAKQIRLSYVVDGRYNLGKLTSCSRAYIQASVESVKTPWVLYG